MSGALASAGAPPSWMSAAPLAKAPGRLRCLSARKHGGHTEGPRYAADAAPENEEHCSAWSPRTHPCESLPHSHQRPLLSDRGSLCTGAGGPCRDLCRRARVPYGQRVRFRSRPQGRPAAVEGGIPRWAQAPVPRLADLLLSGWQLTFFAVATPSPGHAVSAQGSALLPPPRSRTRR